MHNSTIYAFFPFAPTCNRKNTDCRIVHLMVLTRVLIYHNARNDLHRSVKDALTLTRPGTVFYCATLRSHTGVEDYALLTGEGLRTFRWNVVPSSWTFGPEDEGKLASREGETSHTT